MQLRAAPRHPLGRRLVLTYKWDAGRALELIEREGVTAFSGVPTMTRELLSHPDWATRDTSSLRGLSGGGAAFQPDLVQKVATTVRNAQPGTGYGLTETHGIVTVVSARNFLAKPASAGPVVPTLDAKLIDEMGNDVPPSPDAVGELCVRGAVVIKGYLNRPSDRRGDPRRLVPHRRHRPHRRGRLRLHRRPGQGHGEPRRRETCTAPRSRRRSNRHDAVAEAAVFGIPDERLGEDCRRRGRAA